MFRFLLCSCTLVLLASPLRSQSGNDFETFFKTARKFSVKPLAAKPAWAESREAPLFRVAWLSDLHIINQENQRLSVAACHLLRDRLRPDLTFITGDNCGWPASFFRGRSAEHLDRNRQRWLKEFLDRELRRRYLVLPGDNWPGAFAEIFGSSRRSFVFGGFHFLFLAADAMAPDQEGCQVFFPETLAWLDDTLRRHDDKPTLLVMHEPVYPPGLLDAHKIESRLSRSPQVIAALAGHLHLDLEFDRGHWKQLLAPALGDTPPAAFKIMAFHRDRVVIETWEADAKGAFRQHPLKWQQVAVPEALRRNLHAVTPSRAPQLEQLRELPAREVILDPALDARAPEYLGQCMAFVIDFALTTILP